MNYLQIFGFILITIGTIISFVGSYQQSTKDDDFKNNVSEFVEKKKDEQKPILKIVKVVVLNNNSFLFVVKNIGKETAVKPKLRFSEKSFPNAFSANDVYGLEEVPQGLEITFSVDLFKGIKLLTKLPNEDVRYKEDLLKNIAEYQNNNKAFIPRFYLEYFYEGKKLTTETYMLIIENKNGIIYFGKDN